MGWIYPWRGSPSLISCSCRLLIEVGTRRWERRPSSATASATVAAIQRRCKCFMVGRRPSCSWLLRVRWPLKLIDFVLIHKKIARVCRVPLFSQLIERVLQSRGWRWKGEWTTLRAKLRLETSHDMKRKSVKNNNIGTVVLSYRESCSIVIHNFINIKYSLYGGAFVL